MSKVVKNQHYVPRLYLRGFAKPQGKDYKICVYDKENGVVRVNQSIDNVGAERYFYDLEYEKVFDVEKVRNIKEDDENYEKLKEFRNLDITSLDEQFMEKHFSESIEPRFKIMLDTIKSAYMLANKENIENFTAISHENKLNYALLLAIQFMRTKEFKQSIEEMPKVMVEIMKRRQRLMGEDVIDIDPNLVSYTKEYAKFQHLRWLMDDDSGIEFANVFCNHIWYIGVNNTPVKLYTSDNPIVRIPHYNGHLGGSGINSIGIEIVFPITPELVLVMKHREYHKEYEKYENKYKFLNVAEVILYNKSQIYGAYRSIFSIDNKFDVAEMVQKLNPEVSNINRRRMVMGNV